VSRAAAKVTISLERDVFVRAERLRKRSGESRSALVGRALRELLRHDAMADEARRYVDAYRRMPETVAEVRRARRLARHGIIALPWED
jgi:metal-responsive CopG/Arc/MetJ family transcriptional regulator